MMRNYLTLLIFIGLCHGDSSTNTTITDDTMRRLLDYFKQVVSPVQTIPDIDYISNSTKGFLNASMTNAQVEDLRNFDVVSTRADMEHLNFLSSIFFPTLNVSGDYTLYSDRDILYLVGSGPFRINASGLLLRFDVKLGFKEDYTLFLEHFIVDYEVEALNVNFTNLGEDEEASVTYNDLINTSPEILAEFKPDVQAAIEKKAKEYGSLIFGGLSVEQCIDLIFSSIPDEISFSIT